MTGRDSGGVPWAGRELPGSGLEHDTGAADPAVRGALAAGDVDALAAVLPGARLLVPVVAAAAEVDENGADKVSEMAAVTLVAPDGRRALPAFTGTDALAAWDPSARPVPVTAQRAAQAALGEGCELLVLDPAGPTARELPGSLVWALADGREWMDPAVDEHVRTTVAACLADVPQVRTHHLEPTGSGTLRLVLELVPGLDADTVSRIVGDAGEQIAADDGVRRRVDGIAVALR